MTPKPVLVYKFGGASVRSAEAVQNLLTVLESAPKSHHLAMVVSAMGKTTNGLEGLLRFTDANAPECLRAWQSVYDFHAEIIEALFSEPENLLSRTEVILSEALAWLEKRETLDFDCLYDQVVSLGEQVSTLILAEWLQGQGKKVAWFDARHLIRTDANYREARVNWSATAHQLRRHVVPLLNRREAPIVLTQGFVGATLDGLSTTLGREGSDYSAAILSYCLKAQSMVIWKDVAGVLNGDPREMPSPELLPELSYQDAIEMAYFGATVIHPKTLQPLHEAGIPLEVKSFLNPRGAGTRIAKETKSPGLPCFIIKRGQALLTLVQEDFRFATEGLLSETLQLLHRHKLKIHMVQHGALQVEWCVEGDARRLEGLTESIAQLGWQMRIEQPFLLVTVYQAGDLKEVPKFRGMGSLRMEQRNHRTWRLLYHEEA